MAVIVALLVLWLVCIIVGLVVHAVAWLAILGAIFFLITAVAGAAHRTIKDSPPHEK
jgi:hypothetical protein